MTTPPCAVCKILAGTSNTVQAPLKPRTGDDDLPAYYLTISHQIQHAAIPVQQQRKPEHILEKLYS